MKKYKEKRLYVYSFNELNEKAKNVVRNKYNGVGHDWHFFDTNGFVFDEEENLIGYHNRIGGLFSEVGSNIKLYGQSGIDYNDENLELHSLYYTRAFIDNVM